MYSAQPYTCKFTCGEGGREKASFSVTAFCLSVLFPVSLVVQMAQTQYAPLGHLQTAQRDNNHLPSAFLIHTQPLTLNTPQIVETIGLELFI